MFVLPPLVLELKKLEYGDDIVPLRSTNSLLPSCAGGEGLGEDPILAGLPREKLSWLVLLS